MLKELLAEAPEAVRYSVPFDAPLEDLLEQARSFGLEGLLGKQPDARYESGRRGGAWIKLKLILSQEFVIGGYTPPAGGRKYFGAIIVGYYSGDDLYFASKVCRGFSEKTLKELYAQIQSLDREDCPFSTLHEKRNRRRGHALPP